MTPAAARPPSPPHAPDTVPPGPLVLDAAQCMHLRLQLRRDRPDQPWSAELAVPGASGRLTFPTLDALTRWLARLDRRPGGLR